MSSAQAGATARQARQLKRGYERMIDSSMWLARALALVWGAVYTVLAVQGFSLADLSRFAGPRGGGYFLGLRINGLAAVLYLIVGACGLLASVRREWAERYLRLLCTVGVVLFIAAIFMTQATDNNWIAANGHIIGLGLITAIGAVW